jgi:UDP-N-acetyl-D-mannosaminuronic acid dehydrogenase
VGLGYIGLPTAAILASRKKTVIGVDVDQKVVDTVNRGQIHIVEPELDIVVRAAVTEGYLRATIQPEPSDAFLIAVPTPFKNDHEPDLAFVEAAARSIAPVLAKGNVVILESTSPVGTTEQMAEWLSQERTDLSFPHTHGENSDIRIAYCPERVWPGRVLRELVENDRVIGGLTPKCSKVASDLYSIFVDSECVVTTARTAEMVKLTENSFRDVNIAFANELSIICEKLGIDVWELIRLANRHPRVDVLRPGPGVGGHCIAVDPWFIVHTNPNEARLIGAARRVNDYKPEVVLDLIRSRAQKLGTKNVTCLGATFKADIDDLRESPALRIIERLLSEGFDVQVVEPNIDLLPGSLSANAQCRLISLADVIESGGERVLAILVGHKEFIREADELRSLNQLDFCGVLTDYHKT